MSHMSQALASLAGTYTDSEGEEDMDEGETSPEKESGLSVHPASAPSTPKIINSAPPSEGTVSLPCSPGKPQKPKRLVSYNNDDLISDDENDDMAPPDPDTDEENDEDRFDVVEKADKDDELSAGGVFQRELGDEPEDDGPITKPEILQEDGLSIPPPPPGKCPAELQEKIANIYAKYVSEGRDMNRIIQGRKDFRNPSIYEKLIEFCKINELDTNYPPEIYDPLRWGKESYFEELAKAQKVEMDRREKERQEKLAKIDFKTGFVKKPDADDDPKRRKSKWDQAAPNSVPVKPTVKPAGVVQPSLMASGTKSTVIPAFGSLPKRPRM